VLKAVILAMKELAKTFNKSGKTNSDSTVGEILSNDGYVNMKDFQIVN
jgi:hypothetical protein